MLIHSLKSKLGAAQNNCHEKPLTLIKLSVFIETYLLENNIPRNGLNVPFANAT